MLEIIANVIDGSTSISLDTLLAVGVPILIAALGFCGKMLWNMARDIHGIREMMVHQWTIQNQHEWDAEFRRKNPTLQMPDSFRIWNEAQARKSEATK